MDGVEYIDAAIRAVRHHLGEAGFEIRIDEDSFIPGLTLRRNLERELTDADFVIVFLDGLRPNVVYELGFAYGQRLDTNISDDQGPRIICLAEFNATVLVRNLYPSPFEVPTVDGSKVKILNPRLDICRMFSDNSDLLMLYYDRLNLDRSLGEKLVRLLGALTDSELKQVVVNEATTAEAAEPPPPQEESGEEITSLWKLYQSRHWNDVVRLVTPTSSVEERKVLALSLMKLGRLYEAIKAWRDLESLPIGQETVLFHLGVCHYALRQLETAAFYFQRAKELGSKRSELYLTRIQRQIERRATSGTSFTERINNIVEELSQTQEDAGGSTSASQEE